MKKLLSKKYAAYIPAILHFLISIAVSGKVFKNTGESITGTIAVRNIVSTQFETVLTYILSVAFAGIIIVMLWQLVFHIIREFQKTYIIFLVLYVIGCVFIFLTYPESFTYSGSRDNFITYACAVRLTPDYWHNAYSSIAYAGCLLVFPTSISIPLIQWSFFLFLVGYVFHRIKAVCSFRIVKYLVFLVFFLPNTIFIILNAYRIYQYTILFLIYVSIIVFDIIEKKNRPLNELITISTLGAFLCVWRSEGIIICPLLFLIYLFGTMNKPVKYRISLVILFIASILMISIPHKIGIKKYYGKDYSIINSMNVLQVLFFYDADFSYPGADKDLEAINTITPRDLITEYSIDGYRYYNYAVKGNEDFNQTAATDEEAAAFLSAYRNIILHNPKFMIKYALETPYLTYRLKHIFYYYPIEHTFELPTLNASSWDIGEEEFLSDIPESMKDSNRMLLKLYRRRTALFDALLKNGIMFGVFAAILIMNIFFFVRGVILFLKKRDRIRFSLGLAGLALFVEYLALFVFVPAPLYDYFVIYNYGSLLLGLACLAYDIKIRFQKDRCTP